MSILFGPQSTRIADVVDQPPTTVPKRNPPDRQDHEAGRQSDYHNATTGWRAIVHIIAAIKPFWRLRVW